MPVKHGTNRGYTFYKCRCDQCREAHRVAAALDRERNGKRVNATKRRKYAEDPSQVLEYNRRWRAANPDKVEKIEKRKREIFRERRVEWSRALYLLNRQRYIEDAKKWKKTPQGRASNKVYFAKRRGVPYTPEAKAWIESLVDPICTYCGGAATTIDHIVPITKGGTGERDNLTPACVSCNSRKHNMSLDDFIARLTKDKES